MKIFEFYFNPQGEQNRYFKAFSFDTLHIAGELANALPQNSRFLDKLAAVIKEAYEASENFKEALKAANEFFTSEVKRGNVDWLGNLHLGVLAFKRKDNSSYIFSGAKTGNISLFLTRNGALQDVKTHLENAKVMSDPSKVFGNTVSGKLLPRDKVLLCTPGLFETFSRQNTFHDLAYFTHEQQFQGLFKSKEKELSKTPGLLFGVLIEEVVMKKVTRPSLKAKLPTITFPHLKFPSLPQIRIPVLPKPGLRFNFKPNFRNFLAPQMKRRILFILLFIVMLSLGSLLF